MLCRCHPPLPDAKKHEENCLKNDFVAAKVGSTKGQIHGSGGGGQIQSNLTERTRPTGHSPPKYEDD